MAKKIYYGEDDARFALGKCFIFENSIGKVVKTAKNYRLQRWEVWFKRIRNNSQRQGSDCLIGLDDYFVYGACAVRSAAGFVKEAVRVDEKVLLIAHKISADAGRKIDQLIAKALEEVNNQNQ